MYSIQELVRKLLLKSLMPERRWMTFPDRLSYSRRMLSKPKP